MAFDPSSSANFFSHVPHYVLQELLSSTDVGNLQKLHTYHVLCTHRFTYLEFSAQALLSRVNLTWLSRILRPFMLYTSGIALILCYKYIGCFYMSSLECELLEGRGLGLYFFMFVTL